MFGNQNVSASEVLSTRDMKLRPARDVTGIYNRSDPLSGHSFDLSFTLGTFGDGESDRSSFLRQFDQRYNLIEVRSPSSQLEGIGTGRVPHRISVQRHRRFKRLARLRSNHQQPRRAASQPGNSGRNAFRGPRLCNVDLSVSRSFSLKHLGDTGGFIAGTGAFNLLNHANLGNPDSLLASPTLSSTRCQDRVLITA